MSDYWINFNDLGTASIQFFDTDETVDDFAFAPLFDKPIETISMEFTIAQPDPDLLGLLTGGAMGNPPEPTFAIEATYPIKRTFWQWLFRKPRQYGHVYIPHARLEES